MNQKKVPNTVLSTSVEVLVAVLVVLAWVLGAKNGVFTQDYTYFNYDNRLSTLVFSTFLIIWTLWQAHRSNEITENGKWPKLTNLKQAKLINWLYRVEAVIIALFMMLIPFQRFNATWLICGMAVATMISGIVFLILIHRAKE